MKILDFGNLKVCEKECKLDSGQEYLLLEFDGFCDGFQEGSAGKFCIYLDEDVPKRTNILVIDLSKCTFFADVAYAIVKKQKRLLKEQGGGLLLVSPIDSLKEVFQIADFPYSKNFNEVEKIIKKL